MWDCLLNFVVFLSQHGTNYRTVLLLVGLKITVFLYVWGVVCVISVQSSTYHCFKKRRKMPTMYILTVSPWMRSVTHLLLKAWALCNECVPISLPPFLTAVNMSDLPGLNHKADWFPPLTCRDTAPTWRNEHINKKTKKKKTGKLKNACLQLWRHKTERLCSFKYVNQDT